MSELVILSGLPRSGKSTYSKKYKDLGYHVIELDQVRMDTYYESYNEDLEPSAWDEARDQLRQKLTEGCNVLLDESNPNIMNVMYWIKDLPVECSIKIILIPTAMDICVSRTEDPVLKAAIVRKSGCTSSIDQFQELCDRIDAELEVYTGE